MNVTDQVKMTEDTKTYIYESPDSGKTIYRRKMGESKKELVDEDEWERARKYHGDSW